MKVSALTPLGEAFLPLRWHPWHRRRGGQAANSDLVRALGTWRLGRSSTPNGHAWPSGLEILVTQGISHGLMLGTWHASQD